MAATKTTGTSRQVSMWIDLSTTQMDSKIVSNLEGAILNSNETWLLGDVNINVTETNPLPSQTLSDTGLHQLISIPDLSGSHIFYRDL